ncbi:glycoprotease family-domain-containing protein [Nemania serpens]|nr:glycoprotease family-domain-containing protein [Nemania serpens]
MSALWKSTRQCLPGGSLYLQRSSPPAALGPRQSSASTLRRRPRFPSHQSRRGLLTLAIETSCDDTCVAILEKDAAGIARLHFNERITSDNRAFGGVHPLVAVVSHTEHLAPLVRRALHALPRADEDGRTLAVDGSPRRRPDFVSVTRGPGMTSNLSTGLSMGKGLAVAWDVPLLAVNHMQAHALTPRLVGALEGERADEDEAGDSTARGTGDRGLPHQRPRFPFLSLLVSGGHTMLVRSRSLNDHAILANSPNIAVGDMLDKCARMILPAEVLSAEGSGSGMYGPVFEEFAFPGSKDAASHDYDYDYTPPTRRADEVEIFDSGHGWTLTPPLSRMGMGEAAASTYEFAGLNGQVQKLMLQHADMDVAMRRTLARATMTLAFQHLASRLVFALQSDKNKSTHDISDTEAEGQSKVQTIVLSGGVASNRFLRHVVRKMLDIRGFAYIELVAPPPSLCTDNAAMIAWTGMEMYENGWRSDLGVQALRKWPIDPGAEGGGILGASGWYRAPPTE